MNKYKEVGLFVLRLGLGGMFIFHGAPKLFGGPDTRQNVGMAITNFGIPFAPGFWGFMAAISEFFGGVLIFLGLFFGLACILLTLTMTVDATMHLNRGDGLARDSPAIENGFVFLSLIFIGPGKYSLDEVLKPA